MTSKKLTLGIDEAGRGPAIGPMVMAAVVLDTAAARQLSRAGLRDSKSYGPSAKAKIRRKELANKVRELAVHVQVSVIDVVEVDRRVKRGELNKLERDVATHFLNRAPSVDRIVADGKTLFSALTSEFPHLEALNDGESRHAAVAAASVLAKDRRDTLYRAIAKRYQAEFGEIRGGGYINTPTKTFLRAYAEKYKRLPPEARHSWPYRYLDDILGQGYNRFDEVPVEMCGQYDLFAKQPPHRSSRAN